MDRLANSSRACHHLLEFTEDDAVAWLYRALLLMSLAHPVVGHDAAAAAVEPEANESSIGPVTVSGNTQGVDLQTQVTMLFSTQRRPDGIEIRARIFADLSDLQRKFGALVDAQNLPRNNCASYSANNPVVTIDRKRMDLDGDQAVVTLGGNVDVWDCRENPIPCTAVEWRNDGLFGLPSPTVRSWSCNPFKNKLLSQPVDMRLPLTLEVVGRTAVRLNMGRPNVALGGDPVLSALRDLLLNLFRVDPNSVAGNTLRSAVDPGRLVLALPESFLRLNPRIDAARFGDVYGNLGIHVTMSVVARPEDVAGLLRFLPGDAAHPN